MRANKLVMATWIISWDKKLRMTRHWFSCWPGIRWRYLCCVPVHLVDLYRGLNRQAQTHAPIFYFELYAQRDGTEDAGAGENYLDMIWDGSMEICAGVQAVRHQGPAPVRIPALAVFRHKVRRWSSLKP